MAERAFKRQEEQEYREQFFVDEWFDIGQECAEEHFEQGLPALNSEDAIQSEFEAYWKKHLKSKTKGKQLAGVGFSEGWYDFQAGVTE